jgi:hypothetical protein
MPVSLVVQRLIQAITFRRDAYLWMLFNDRSTGDALVLVVATQVVIWLGLGVPGGFDGFLRGLFGGAWLWIVFSGIAWAVARFFMQGEGSYAPVLRVAGFAFPTRLLIILVGYLEIPWQLALVLGNLWFLAVVAAGIAVLMEIPRDRAAAAAIAGLAGYILVELIFGGFSSLLP